MPGDADYFRGRAQEEIEAATVADSTAARKAHLELAERYHDLAEGIEQSDRRNDVSSTSRSAGPIL